jgi:hypothetical protein
MGEGIDALEALAEQALLAEIPTGDALGDDVLPPGEPAEPGVPPG